MADWVYAAGRHRPDYRGLPGLFGFVNADGQWCRFNCGQAAGATLLASAERVRREAAAMRLLEHAFPPNILGGWLGTSPRQVQRLCHAHQTHLAAVRGRAKLCRFLAQGRPAAVLLSVCAGRYRNWDLPGGHWVVAYGYDDDAVYLTNWGPGGMNWGEFMACWGGWVPRLMGVRWTGLAPGPEAPCQLQAGEPGPNLAET